MREKPTDNFACLGKVGITPAYAGKTFQQLLPFDPHWDHPRVCGKNEFLNIVARFPRGSPPRVREKLLQYQVAAGVSGITPAYAGKTLLRTCSKA
ncbi:hypothetical protein HMPREF3190_01687 [Umbribacter vaginalis]|nr:hypothetical protein HMPREF3190_01687 [Coriobacteriales bacterium DNF00809]